MQLDQSKETIEQETSDAVLIARMQQGNERAWALLLKRYSGRVFGSAYRILGDRACAEDVKQEVFLHLLTKPALFASVRGNLGSWLATSAKNRSIDLLRQRRPMDSIHERDFASAEDFGRMSEHRLVMGKLIPLMEDLPQEQQELLHMSFFLGFSHSEIAAQTQRPLGTVKTVIRSALDQLRSRVAA